MSDRRERRARPRVRRKRPDVIAEEQAQEELEDIQVEEVTVEEAAEAVEELPKPKITRTKVEDIEGRRYTAGKLIINDTDPLAAIVEKLQEGQTLAATKTRKGMDLNVYDPEVLARAFKPSHKEYWEEVLNPKFSSWKNEWNALPEEEKFAEAKRLNVSSEEYEHETYRMKMMKLGFAVRTKLGIEKYKPEYMDASKRKRYKDYGIRSEMMP